jgi:hypothetical protein
VKIGIESIRIIAHFFALANYDDYAKELLHAWEVYHAKKENLLSDLKYSAPDNIDDLHKKTKDYMAEYETALQTLKKTFGFYVRKIAVLTNETDGEKWRRCLP